LRKIRFAKFGFYWVMFELFICPKEYLSVVATLVTMVIIESDGDAVASAG